MTFTIITDEKFTVTLNGGTPRLILNNNAEASLISTSLTDVSGIDFRYTVAQTDINVLVLDLSSNPINLDGATF